MKLCVVSHKECWQNPAGQWVTSGGFPMQMAALSSLFSATTLVVIGVKPQNGGAPLPASARVVPLSPPPKGDARRKLAVITRLPAILAAIRREAAQADVIHAPVPGDIGLLGLWTALAMRKRLLVRYGSSWPTTPQVTLMNRVTKFFTRTFAGGRNVMLATGAGSTPPAPNMHWIFSTAISTAEIRQIQPDLERPMSRPPRLAFMGRLAPEKGLPYLIQALAHLRAGGLNPLPVVELVGDGPLRRKLEEQVNQLGLQSNVHFIGALSRHEMLERLCGMDLAVLPSLTESFMKARLDAMLCGLPVITTGVGFGRELVGSDGCRGWIVPVGDSRALADTLATAINGQQDWAGLRKRSREFAETYTVEAWAQHIAEICERQWHLPLDGGKLSE